VLGMKSMGNGIILKSKTVTPTECLHYALNLPTSVVITGCDSMKILDQAIEAARTFRPMSAADVQALLAKTKAAASKGEFELFKTSSIFDSTATHPEWLGEEPHRLKEIIDQSATRLESSIAGLGFQFAILRATSKLSSEGAINDYLQGIGMLHEIRRLARLGEAELGEVIAKLASIRTTLFRQGSIHVIVTCEESMVDSIAERLSGLIAALPSGHADGQDKKPDPLPPVPEARTAPLQVAFNVRGFKTVRYTHPDAPALLVLANYLRDTFLHRELREKGGAYGAVAQASVGGGTFYLASYRDPYVTRTYDTFDRAARWVVDGEVNDEALKEAILGACGDVDPLESPDIKGRREATNRLTGFTRAERERFKKRLLEVTAADLRRIATTYLIPNGHAQTTIAGPELIEAAIKERPGLFEVVAPV